MKATYQIFANANKEVVVATVTIDAPTLTGAERAVVLLGDDGSAVAVLQIQPSFDRRQITQES